MPIHTYRARLASIRTGVLPLRSRHGRGVAQPGRALSSGGRGRRFESSLPDQFRSPQHHFARVIRWIRAVLVCARGATGAPYTEHGFPADRPAPGRPRINHDSTRARIVAGQADDQHCDRRRIPGGHEKSPGFPGLTVPFGTLQLAHAGAVDNPFPHKYLLPATITLGRFYSTKLTLIKR